MKRRHRLAAAMMTALTAAMPWPAAAKQPFVEANELHFRLPDLAGNLVSSQDARFAGRVLLVDLWATWCPPCISEIPTLIELQADLGDRGLVIVAIAFERDEQAEERRARLRRLVAERGINYLVLDGGRPEDFETALPSVGNVQGLPVEILVDRGGGVVAARNGYGYKKKWAARLRREIEALLKEPAPRGAPPRGDGGGSRAAVSSQTDGWTGR